MSSEGETLTSFKSNVEDMALEELQRLTTRRDTVASELAALDESLKGVRQILRTLNPEQKKQRKTAKSAGQKVSAAVRSEFLSWAAGYEGDITSRIIADGLGISSSLATTLAKQMREEGVIRLSATSGPTNIYRSEV